MKKFIYILALVLAMLPAGCAVKKSQAYYDYSSKVIQSHGDGVYAIRTWGRARNMDQSRDMAMKRAVEDVIFKGVQAQTGSIESLKPLCFDMNSREKNENYWNTFFAEKGPWKQYCSADDRRICSTKYVRTDAQVVAEMTVTVNRAGLKRRLQSDGILPR